MKDVVNMAVEEKRLDFEHGEFPAGGIARIAYDRWLQAGGEVKYLSAESACSASADRANEMNGPPRPDVVDYMYAALQKYIAQRTQTGERHARLSYCVSHFGHGSEFAGKFKHWTAAEWWAVVDRLRKYGFTVLEDAIYW